MPLLLTLLILSGTHPVAAEVHTLIGQLILPEGEGSRGVEVQAHVLAGDRLSETWLLLDETGRFEHRFEGELLKVTVTVGIGGKLDRIAGEDLPKVVEGTVDVGAIDLRERMFEHRVVISAAEGSPAGSVRTTVCYGLPPKGPRGGSVSLGSRQFPTRELGDAVDWLIPSDAEEIYFLVERPDGPHDERVWRSGYQKLFGPFEVDALPTQLKMDGE